MKRNSLIVRPFMAVTLIAAFVFQFLPQPINAADGPRIIIEIGQPAVWSLGQAHYLLAKMHRRDRKLSTRFPDEGDLDSNKISATRIEALRSSLGVEGQFDQAMGVKNDIARKRSSESEERRTSARTDLTAKQAELQQVDSELAELNEQIAVTQEEDRQRTEARAATTPPTPPTAEDNERKKQLVLMDVRKKRKEQQRTELKEQITALKTTADTPSTTPTFEQPALTTTPGGLPTSDAFKDFMKKAVDEAGKPDLSASQKLDNFVQMQYEIISKQLTLLRDEVGPDDRVIFLELPASIYTVDKKADDYVAQVEWKVESACDREPPMDIQARVIHDIMLKEGKTEEDAQEAMDRISTEMGMEWRIIKATEANPAFKSNQDKQTTAKTRRDLFLAMRTDAVVEKALAETVTARKKKGLSGSGRAPYPITLEMIRQYEIAAANDERKPCPAVNKDTVRAIDIIPRQSALNVNERHAVVKQTMLVAGLKFLMGFAGRVDYQRQRELYEQFVQQQIFASGYGKGDDKFGWTYGPQPGTNRIAPGQKTTFAVLVVPRTTLAVHLTAKSKFYKRTISPKDPDSVQFSGTNAFFLSVPGKRTQEFWVDGVSYSPVKRGRRVTAVIEGNYFSPQLGIMVNGVPLEPVLSISRIAGSDEEADVQSADGVVGEYEVTNSRQIILSFTMGDSYVGTPTITFTSPEKTTAINFFDLDINHKGLNSLQERAVQEPMFLEDFNDKLEMELIKDVPLLTGDGSPANLNGDAVPEDEQASFRLVRLKGLGLRPNGNVVINDTSVELRNDLHSLKDVLDELDALPTPRRPFAIQDSTKAYLVYFGDGKPKWKVSYRQLTRQGYEEGASAKDFSPPPPFQVHVKSYRFFNGTAEVGLNISSKRRDVKRADVADPASGTCSAPIKIDANLYRVKCSVPGANNGKLERNSALIAVTTTDASGNSSVIFQDVDLPIRPALLSVSNPRTGFPSGFATEQPVVVISGANLSGVTGVLFGSEKGEVTGVSADSITVTVPKHGPVNRGEAVSVPIVFQTAAEQIPTGAIYTFLGEPPEVLLWPGRRPRRRSN